MSKSYRTIHLGGTGEIVEKKSRFIANTAYVSSEEEALEFIEQQRKNHWDARHNCYAYVIGYNDEIQRCSDDGEPSKTAGRPILDILLLENLHNAVVVVTRYFGGTLLGTGGLVRAYQSAAKEGIHASTIIERYYGFKVQVITDYTGIGKLQYIAAQYHLTVLQSDYTDLVTTTLLVPEDLYTEYINKATEAVNGKITVTIEDKVYYADVDGTIKLFDK